jgi:hypothetical protein
VARVRALFCGKALGFGALAWATPVGSETDPTLRRRSGRLFAKERQTWGTKMERESLLASYTSPANLGYRQACDGDHARPLQKAQGAGHPHFE